MAFHRHALAAVTAGFLAGTLLTGAASAQTAVKQVSFTSMDGTTALRGFFYKPTTGAGPFPAIVLLHGCGGAYSKKSGGVTLDAATIEAAPSKYINSQYKDWAAWAAGQGYALLLVDSFGPRGQTLGVCDVDQEDRPSDISDVYRRPLDAYAGLKFLKDNAASSAYNIKADRVALVGFSHGGSTTLSTVADTGPSVWHNNVLPSNPGLVGGFRVAVAYYPGCGLQNAYKNTYHSGTPLQVFTGQKDTTTPAVKCEALKVTAESVAAAQSKPVNFSYRTWANATHSFDQATSSDWTSQETTDNNAARADARADVQALFTAKLKN